MLNLFFFHARCKQMRFCNKICEKDVHTMQKSEKEALAMEKSTKKQPEIPNETEDLLEKEKKSEIKRKEKRNRKIIRAVKLATSSSFVPNNKHTVMMCEALKK